MIKRDQYGIIVQHNLDHPDQMDGGDSASRTGIMAMCGSIQDGNRLVAFAFKDGLVRHPKQWGWADPEKTSRDQLICYAAGVHSCGWVLSPRVVVINYARGNFINKDVLLPHVRFALYKAAGYLAPLWIRLLAKPMMIAHLIWSCRIRPNEEQNQTVCLCSIYGDWWIRKIYDWHPNLGANLYDYWAGKPWRDQKEIAENIMTFILKR